MNPIASDHVFAALPTRVTEFGGSEPAILALHGFTGSGLDFDPLAQALGLRMLAPDLAGHGHTAAPEDPSGYGIEQTEQVLLAGVDELRLERPVLLGYSMGGRIALYLACRNPGLFSAVVLVGATPGIPDRAARLARARSDEEIAQSIEERGVEDFARRWEKHPVIASQQRIEEATLAAMRERRLANRPQGLAGSLRGMGTGVMPPMWSKLKGVGTPVLLVTGAEDRKFHGIAERMLEQLPSATHEVVNGAGHCAHLEQPAQTARLVLDFLT